MKKLLFSSALLMGSFMSSFAQTQAGAIAIGGDIGLSVTSSKNKVTTNGTTTETDGDKNTTLNFVPNVSYFLSDKFALGIGIGYMGNSGSTPYQNGTSNYKLKYTGGTFIVNPYAKYYIGLGEKTYFFLKGDIALGFGKTKNQYFDAASNSVKDGDPQKTTNFGIGVLPGILFFPAPKVGIELALGSPYNYLLGFGTTSSKSTTNGTETINRSSTFSFLNLNTIGASVSVYYFIK
jgi:hypothetical protein